MGFFDFDLKGSDLFSAGAGVIGSLIGGKSNRDANRDSIAAQTAARNAPVTDAFGNVSTPQGVTVSERSQPVIDAITNANQIARDSTDAFNTSGFFGGESDPNNPFSRPNAERVIEQDNQRIQNAFINPAVDRLTNARIRNIGSASSGFTQGLDRDLLPIIDAIKIGDQAAIDDYILSSLDPADRATSFINAASTNAPSPGGIDANLLNATRPPAVQPDNTLPAIIAAIGGLGDRSAANQAAAQEQKRNSEILDIFRKQLGNQANTSVNPVSLTPNMFLG